VTKFTVATHRKLGIKYPEDILFLILKCAYHGHFTEDLRNGSVTDAGWSHDKDNML